MLTRKQNDAIRALTHIEQIKATDKKIIQDYCILVNRFPIMVRQNGLQQALGFIKGKSGGNNNGAEDRFLAHIAEMLRLPNNNLIDTVLNPGLERYQYYTRRCLESAVWYRRFSESVLGVDASGQPGDKEQEGDDADSNEA